MAYLTEAVWERPPAAPESNIRTYVSGLRRCLGDRAGRLTAQAGGYRFSVHPGEVDAAAFAGLIARADAALRGGEAETAVGQFERALALWRGRPLEGLQVGMPLQAEVVRLEELRRRAAQRYAQAAAGIGRRDETVSLLYGLAAEHPLDEGVWADLMSALHSTGRRGHPPGQDQLPACPGRRDGHRGGFFPLSRLISRSPRSCSRSSPPARSPAGARTGPVPARPRNPAASPPASLASRA